MALRDPVVVYRATTNMQAYLVRDALAAAGIEACVIEQFTSHGGGKPQVLVERVEAELARPVLEDFDRRAVELQPRRAAGDGSESTITTVCEECGREAEFPAVQGGSVQNCPHCGAYLDV
jgi:hypothetical protein